MASTGLFFNYINFASRPLSRNGIFIMTMAVRGMWLMFNGPYASTSVSQPCNTSHELHLFWLLAGWVAGKKCFFARINAPIDSEWIFWHSRFLMDGLHLFEIFNGWIQKTYKFPRDLRNAKTEIKLSVDQHSKLSVRTKSPGRGLTWLLPLEQHETAVIKLN